MAAALDGNRDVIDSWLHLKAAQEIARTEAGWEVERAEEAAREAAEPAWVYSDLLGLDEDERVLFEEDADNLKLERYFRGRSRGFSFRIARGITYRTGEMIGRRERDEKWSVADTGTLSITTKKVVFRGEEDSFEISHRSIRGVTAYGNSEVAIQARSTKRFRLKVSLFADDVAAHLSSLAGRTRRQRRG
jgi:hypothetical protein